MQSSFVEQGNHRDVGEKEEIPDEYVEERKRKNLERWSKDYMMQVIAGYTNQ